MRIGISKVGQRYYLRARWGEVCQNEKGGVNLLNELSIGFGLIAYTLPFGIITEGLPIGGGGIAVRMREDVDESFAFERFVGGRPVRHVFHSMFLEELHGVFAKAAQQVAQLAFVSVIDTELIDRGCGLSGARLLLMRSSPDCCWEERYRRKRLKQCASFHGSDSSRAIAQRAGRRHDYTDSFQGTGEAGLA